MADFARRPLRGGAPPALQLLREERRVFCFRLWVLLCGTTSAALPLTLRSVPALLPPAAEGGQGDRERTVPLLLRYVFRKGRVFLREGLLLERGEEGRKTSYQHPDY